MSTFYLIYEPAGDPKFHIPDPQFVSNEDDLSQLAEHSSNNYRLIKVENYDEADPESGIMSIVPSGPDSSRPEMSDPVPSVPKITPSMLYYYGIP